MIAIKKLDLLAIAAKGLRGILLTVVALPFFGAIYLFFAHVIEWLKLGKWPHFSTATMFSDWGINYPKADWLGVQAIIDGIMSAPAALTLFGGAVVLGFAFSPFIED